MEVQQQQIYHQFTPYSQYQTLQQQQDYGEILLPEDTEWFQQTDEEEQQPTRLANTALSSWAIIGEGERTIKKISSKLSLSVGHDMDLKTLLNQRGKSELSGLCKAASKGDANAIMNIVKREGLSAGLDEPDNINGCTPLMYAAMADSESAIEMLLNLSVKREQIDSAGRTAVHYAVFFGKAKALKFLIESGSDWSPRDVYGRTPLHWATVPKNPKCLSILLNYANIVNGDINPRDGEGMTPVHCAAQMGSARHITLLIEANSDFSAIDIEGKTALHWTVENKDSSCLNTIIEYYPHLLNKQDGNGQTLLHLTSRKGNIPLVEQLLNIEGIEIDTRDKQDCTPLHLACIEGHTTIVQLQVMFHALDSCIDSYGFTALHYAVYVNSVKCVEFLVRNSYATHVPSADERGVTPLILASEFGYNEVLNALLVNTNIASEINQCDVNGLSALHYATQGGFTDCILTLLEKGSDPNLISKADLTALDIVCQNRHYNCIEPLMKGGANADIFGKDGFTTFHRSILYENLESVKGLINGGCNTELTDKEGRTPLELAVYTGNKDLTAVILQLSNLSPNSMNMTGLSVLHIAASEGHSEVLLLLLVNDGYVNSMDGTENRYTPLDYAQQNSHTECVRILEEKGGLTVHDIQTIAAVWIQTAYRQYRAKKLAYKLRQERSAAICIQCHTRGLLQRKRYHRLQKETNSAIKIQSFIRGFLARKSFAKIMEKHREQERQQKLIEDFGEMFLHSIKDIQPIIVNTDPLEMMTKREEKKEEEIERLRQLKIEQCLKMRECYLKKQEEWEKFRELERQRRKDKAHQEELARIASIIENSQKRRQYFLEKFKYTHSVQSCHQSATVIQRAYRDWKVRLEMERKRIEVERRKLKCRRLWAACVIQRGWRNYREWKHFEANYLDSIITDPIIAMSAGCPTHNFSPMKPYQRDTIASGTQRRRLHQTHQSGFKIFRPLPSTSQSLTRPNNKTTKQHFVLKDASPRIRSMIRNWPWSKQLLFTSSPLDNNTPLPPNDIKLPRLARGGQPNNGALVSPTRGALKLPQLKINQTGQ